MSRVFQRKAVVLVESVKVSDLRVVFKVEKSLSKNPNTADIDIYNLSADSIAKMRRRYVPVVLAAGYGDDVGQLFSGEARSVVPLWQKPDHVTRVKCGDGEQAFSTGFVSESFPPGTKHTDVVKRLAKSAGIGVGNAVKKLAQGNFREGFDEFAHGFTAHGRGVDELDRVVRSAGYTWSIQDGELQLLATRDAINPADAVLVSADTGMVGSPEFSTPEKTKGPPLLKVKKLLDHKLRPGGVIEVRSNGIAPGQFRVEKVTHEGDTHGGNWFSNVEAMALS